MEVIFEDFQTIINHNFRRRKFGDFLRRSNWPPICHGGSFVLDFVIGLLPGNIVSPFNIIASK